MGLYILCSFWRRGDIISKNGRNLIGIFVFGFTRFIDDSFYKQTKKASQMGVGCWPISVYSWIAFIHKVRYSANVLHYFRTQLYLVYKYSV
tara:strand:+ start:16 stop:288 length:273 start_codon:yes stop_codon:yes gene_type:complete